MTTWLVAFKERTFRISGGERLAGNAGVDGNGVAYKACCRKCFKKITDGIERVKND